MYPDKLVYAANGIKIYRCIVRDCMYYKVVDINEYGQEYIIIITANLELAKTYCTPKKQSASFW